MRFSTASVIAATAATASAQNIQVSVGQNGLTFTPSDIKASVGQSVEFSFFPKNHSVTQSSFANPCHPLTGGFFSTFIPTASESNKTFTILVNDTKPIWIYCGQGNHCQSGMLAAINAPATGNTLEAFTALAKNATASTSPPGDVAIGGILKVGSVSKGNSSSSSSSSSSASGSEQKTVMTSITTTVTGLVTSGGSSYTTTFASTYGTTYTTAVAAGATGTGSSSGSSSGSSTGSAATATKAGAANGLAVNGGIAGAALVFALGML